MRIRSVALCTSLSLLLGCQQYLIKREIHEQEESLQTARLQLQKKRVTAEAQSLMDCAKEPPGAQCDQTELGLRKQLSELQQKARVAIQKQHKQELDAQVSQLQNVLSQYDNCVAKCQADLSCRAQCKTDDVTAVIRRTQELLRKSAGAAQPSDDEVVTTSCKQWQRQSRTQNVYIFDGRTETLNPPSGIQYDTKPVYVCIENANYAMRYGVKDKATALPAQDYTSGLASILLPGAKSAESASGGTDKPGLFARVKAATGDLREGKETKLDALAKDQDFLNYTAAFLAGRAPEVRKQLFGKTEIKAPEIICLLSQQRELLKKVLSHLSTDNVASAYQTYLKEAVPTKPDSDRTPPPPLDTHRAAVLNAMATFQETRTSLSAPFLSRTRFAKLVKELAQHRDDLRKAYAALAVSEQDKAKEPEKAGGETDKSLADAALRLLNTLATLEEQLESFGSQPLHFPVAVERDNQVAIVVSGARLKLRQDADQKTESMMVYGDSRELARTSVQIRTLVYVRASLGLAWTSLNNPSFSVAPNQEGTQVLVASQSSELVPMLVLSHYWTGADLRALQPWDTNRRGWWKNMFPTFAIGIPLTKSPFENFFVGAQLQPVPGLSVIGGVNIGKVNVLRDGFTVGAAVPASFRAADAAEQVYRPGGFVGIAVADSLFVKLILSLIQAPK